MYKVHAMPIIWYHRGNTQIAVSWILTSRMRRVDRRGK